MTPGYTTPTTEEYKSYLSDLMEYHRAMDEYMAHLDELHEEARIDAAWELIEATR